MRIVLNGKTCEVIATRLDQVLIECGYKSPSIATALNQTIVHKQDHAQTDLKDGDQLEVVAPIGGG